MKIYYAHCKAIYGTPREKRDIALLEVLNPASEQVAKDLEEWKKSWDFEGTKARQGEPDNMPFFINLVSKCDGLAFTPEPDGKIPCGVAKEIGEAIARGLPIIELPVGIMRRTLSLEETREYLRDVGER